MNNQEAIKEIEANIKRCKSNLKRSVTRYGNSPLHWQRSLVERSEEELKAYQKILDSVKDVEAEECNLLLVGHGRNDPIEHDNEG